MYITQSQSPDMSLRVSVNNVLTCTRMHSETEVYMQMLWGILISTKTHLEITTAKRKLYLRSWLNVATTAFEGKKMLLALPRQKTKKTSLPFIIKKR